MSLLRRSFGSALLAAGRVAAVLAGFAIAGAGLNWLALLGFFPLPGADALELSREQGLLSSTARVALFGVVFPLAWLLAAQPVAVWSAARLVYRRHKDDVLAGITSVLRLDVDADADVDAAQWLARLEELKDAIAARQPAVLRPVVRLALLVSSLPAIEQRIRDGSGPMVTRVAVAVADQIEEQLSEGASIWLWLVGLANAGAIAVAILAA